MLEQKDIRPSTQQTFQVRHQVSEMWKQAGAESSPGEVTPSSPLPQLTPPQSAFQIVPQGQGCSLPCVRKGEEASGTPGKG